MGCRHLRGDWIKEQGYWLCADCWGKLAERPKEYIMRTGVNVLDAKHTGPLQDIGWQAAIAEADGLTLSEFLRTMARRYMRKTRPPMGINAAYDAAIAVLKSLGDPYGDPAYSWGAEGARELADDDMQDWDHTEGNA